MKSPLPPKFQKDNLPTQKKKGRIHIPDTPENVAKSIMRKPPKKAWRFLESKK